MSAQNYRACVTSPRDRNHKKLSFPTSTAIKFAQDAFDGSLKRSLWCEEAEDEVVGGGEVVEVTRVDEDVVVAEKVDGEVFVRRVGLDRVRAQAENGVPARIGVKKFDGGMRAKEGLQLGAIFADAFEELRSKRVAFGKQRRECGLRGRAERKICVGDDFEALERGTQKRRRAAYG